MCTVLTVSRDLYTAAVVDRIYDDARRNDDGWALLLCDGSGAATSVRTLDVSQVELALTGKNWTRMFLHSRMATQGAPSLPNTHGWNTKGTYYMHNGVLTAPEEKAAAVDSMAIGLWLRQGVDHAMSKLRSEGWANVLMIDTNENYYYMHRSFGGSLHTDGLGNYSTYPVGSVSIPVPVHTTDMHELQLTPRPALRLEFTSEDWWTEYQTKWGA